MNNEFPGTAFFYSSWPTVLMVSAFGLSVGAALVVLAQEWFGFLENERREK